jgi:hypothetical protein
MFPFLMNSSLPIAALAAIWWHLDRAGVTTGEGAERRSPLRDELWASWWLIVALATSGLGLMVAVAVGVELLWTRPPLRRWAVLAPGPALWLAWYAAYGVDSPPSGGVRSVVSYAARMLLGGFASLVGGTRWLGVPLIVGFGALIAASIMKGTFGARALASLAAPVAFAVLTAVSRIGVVPAIPPDELRYQWTIGAFLVVAAVELLRAPTADERGRTADHGFEGSPLISIIGRLAIAIAVLANGALLVDSIGDWTDSVEAAVPGVRDNLWVAEAAARDRTLDRDRQLPVSYVKVTTGQYADAVDELGSPLDGLDPADYGGTPDARRAADQAFVDDFGIDLDVVGPVDTAASGMPLGVEDCHATAIERDAPVSVRPPAAIVQAGDAPVTVRLSVFTGSLAGVVLGTVPAGEVGTIALPAVDPPLGYRITVSGDAMLLDCSS